MRRARTLHLYLIQLGYLLRHCLELDPSLIILSSTELQILAKVEAAEQIWGSEHVGWGLTAKAILIMIIRICLYGIQRAVQIILGAAGALR